MLRGHNTQRTCKKNQSKRRANSFLLHILAFVFMDNNRVCLEQEDDKYTRISLFHQILTTKANLDNVESVSNKLKMKQEIKKERSVPVEVRGMIEDVGSACKIKSCN
jgi:hypothetical protein